MNRFLSYLRRWLTQFMVDESGTSMTEFVITLPVMIIIFAGINEIGQVARYSIKSWSRAHVEVFEKAGDVQQASFDELAQNISTGDEYLPAIAGWTAAEQAVRNPPVQKSRIVRAVVLGAEETTYAVGVDTLADDGHLGELVGRTIPTRPFANMIGVNDAVNASTSQFVGRRDTRSILTQSLVSDAFRPSTLGGSSEDCSNLFSQALGRVNDGLDAAGVRPALAAGARYGTIIGKPPEEKIEIGSRVYRFNPYLAMATPPHVFPEGEEWMRPASTLAITRLTMAGCDKVPYSRLLGIFAWDPNGNMTADDIRERKLPSNWRDWALETPTLEQAEIKWPLDYGGDSEDGFNAP